MNDQTVLRVNNITTINKWIAKEGYQIMVHSDSPQVILGLYKPAPTMNEIPEFLKDLVKGNNNAVNTYVQGMYDALNLCK